MTCSKRVLFIHLIQRSDAIKALFVSGACVIYLVVVYQVEDQVDVSVHRLVLSQLRFHSVEPVDESLQSVCELS